LTITTYGRCVAALERHATANLENVWNGRPISKIVLTEPLEVLDGTPVSLIELVVVDSATWRVSWPCALACSLAPRSTGGSQVIHREPP